MRISVGIIGFPQSGKTALFKALAGFFNVKFELRHQTNLAAIPVPDERLNIIADLLKPEKVTPNYIDLIDPFVASSTGEGIPNKLISDMRGADLLLVVIRCFGGNSPMAEFSKFKEEILLSDLSLIESRLLKKKIDMDEKRELEAIKEALNSGSVLFGLGIKEELLKELNLLVYKAAFVVANLDEKELDLDKNEAFKAFKLELESKNVPVLPVCVKLEEELSELNEEEAGIFMEEFGLKERAFNLLVSKCYEVLNLITFYTVVGKETRAWAVERGATIHEAAGVIHSDMEKGFIKAEVVHFDDFKNSGGLKECHQKGLARLEGKEYLVGDGDIVQIRFNV